MQLLQGPHQRVLQQERRRAERERQRAELKRQRAEDAEAYKRLLTNIMYVLLLVCALVGLVYMFSYCNNKECTLWDRLFLFAFPFIIASTIISVGYLIREFWYWWQTGLYDVRYLIAYGIASVVGIVLYYLHYNHYHI